MAGTCLPKQGTGMACASPWRARASPNKAQAWQDWRMRMQDDGSRWSRTGSQGHSRSTPRPEGHSRPGSRRKERHDSKCAPEKHQRTSGSTPPPRGQTRTQPPPGRLPAREPAAPRPALTAAWPPTCSQGELKTHSGCSGGWLGAGRPRVPSRLANSTSAGRDSLWL